MKFLSLRIYVCSGVFVRICRCTCILCAYTTDTGFHMPSLSAFFTEAGLLTGLRLLQLDRAEPNAFHIAHETSACIWGVCCVSLSCYNKTNIAQHICQCLQKSPNDVPVFYCSHL